MPTAATAVAKLSVSVQYAVAAAPRLQVRALIKSALPQGGEVAVRFVDAEEMAKLNGHGAHAANVLSFAYHSLGEPVLGDIAVCPQTAAATAVRYGLSLAHHLAHLVVHGALHLAGFHHDTPAAARKMESAERAVLAQFGIADPYL